MESISNKLDILLADMKDIKEQIKDFSDYQKLQKEKNEIYDTKIEVIENKISAIDLNECAKNIVFYSVEEGEKTLKDLYYKISQIIKSADLEIPDVSIVEIRRLGMLKDGEARPVIIKFIAPRYKYLLFEKGDN